MITAKLKSFAKDSLVYGVGDALGRLISLIMLPILSRAFVPADYGAIDLLGVGYAFLLVGVSLNCFPGINKNYYKLHDTQQKELISSVSFYLISTACIITILFITFSGVISELIVGNHDIVKPIRVLALTLPVELLFMILQLLLRIQRKALLFALTNIALVIFTPLLTFFAVVILKTGIIGVFYSKLISLTLITIVTLFAEKRQFSPTINFDVFRSLIVFTLPGYPGTMIKQLMNFLPRVLLATFAPLSAVGLFGIAFRVSQIMSLYIQSFNRAWGPFAFAHAEKPEERELYSIIFKAFAFSLIFLGLGISLYSKEVIMILTPPEYHSAHYMVGGVAFYLGVRGLTIIFGTILYVTDQVKWVSYLYILQLICFLIAALLLAPRYHTAGLIGALDIAIAIYFVCTMQFTLRHFKFTIPLARILFLLLLATLAVIFFATFDSGLLLAFSLKSLFILLYLYLGLVILLSQQEKKQIKQLLSNVPLIKNYISQRP